MLVRSRDSLSFSRKLPSSSFHAPLSSNTLKAMDSEAEQSSTITRDDTEEEISILYEIEVAASSVGSGDEASGLPRSAHFSKKYQQRLNPNGPTSTTEEVPKLPLVSSSSSSLRNTSPRKKPINKEARRRQREDKRLRSECYEHFTRHSKDILPDPPVEPCDYLRTGNPSQFNDYAVEQEQCNVPRCKICVTKEVYSEKGIFGATAPPGVSAEDHRFSLRIRYRCDKCPWPIPPPSSLSPTPPTQPFTTEAQQRMTEGWRCTCHMRDPKTGEPTPAWYICGNCADWCWRKHDSRFGGTAGRSVKKRKTKRKHKLGYIYRPKGSSKEQRFYCACGSLVSTDREKRSAWCTWCQLPCTP